MSELVGPNAQLLGRRGRRRSTLDAAAPTARALELTMRRRQALRATAAWISAVSALNAYATLERLLAYANTEDGDLADRLKVLLLGPFANAALCLYELGWVTPEECRASARRAAQDAGRYLAPLSKSVQRVRPPLARGKKVSRADLT
jgi:hypothetical protein